MGVIDLVVTDLDGTLWDGAERIHARTLEALRRLQRLEIDVLVATGRRPRSATTALERSGLRLPSIFLDGALGRDVPSGVVFHECTFAPSAAADVLLAFEAAGCSPCVYVDRPDADVAVGSSPSTHPEHLRAIGRWLATDDLRNVVASDRVYAFGVAGGDPERLGEVGRAVRASAPAAAVVTADRYFGGSTLMVRPSGISKWDGVLAYCAWRGLDASRVLAVGDGENDVELLSSAAVACVSGDGCQAALDLADHVLDPALEGGWSAILDLL